MVGEGSQPIDQTPRWNRIFDAIRPIPQGERCSAWCIPGLALSAMVAGHGTIRSRQDYFPTTGRTFMARKYSKKASADVERVMKKRKAGTLKSGRSGRKVTSRKQAIAIGLSEARAEGKKVPKKAAKKRKTAKKKAAKK
jgi:hypothetical protein